VSPSITLGTGLTDAEGNAIESGEAMETAPNSGRWVYTAPPPWPTGTTVRSSNWLRAGIAVTTMA